MPVEPCDWGVDDAPPSLAAWAQPSRAIVDMHYCDKSRSLVLVLGDGSCALLSVPSGGPAQLEELAFSHWVCAPSTAATRARIGASTQMVAVGCANGVLLLFRWAAVRGGEGFAVIIACSMVCYKGIGMRC